MLVYHQASSPECFLTEWWRFFSPRHPAGKRELGGPSGSMKGALPEKWIEGEAAGDRPSDVAVRTLQNRLGAVLQLLPLAAEKAEEDIDYIHELRVWTRRAAAAAPGRRRRRASPRRRSPRCRGSAPASAAASFLGGGLRRPSDAAREHRSGRRRRRSTSVTPTGAAHAARVAPCESRDYAPPRASRQQACELPADDMDGGLKQGTGPRSPGMTPRA